MTEPRIITVYLCAEKIPGVFQIGSDLVQSIQSKYVDEVAVITVPIIPIDPPCLTGDVGKLDVYLMNPSINALECLWPGQAELDWARSITANVGGKVTRDNGLTITWTNPVGDCAECMWWESLIATLEDGEFSPKIPWQKLYL